MTPNSSLLQWLATFKLDGKNSIELKDEAYYNLADGYVCARILNQISPQYFSDKWLDGIKPVAPNGSWRLRVSNLKRILQKIYDYASDLQSPQFRPSAITPDVAVIAQNFDPDQISRLIQLILFCAINSDKKQDYIEKIRDLTTQVKQDIKEAIEELLIKDSDKYNQEINTSQLGNDSSEEIDLDNDSRRLSGASSSSHTATITPISRSSMQKLVRDSSQLSAEALLKRGKNKLDNLNARDAQNSSETVEELRQKLNDALKIKDEKAQACHDLELKVMELEMAKEQLVIENEILHSDNGANKSTIQKITNSRRNSAQFHKFTDSDTDDRLSNAAGLRKDHQDSRDLLVQHNHKLQSEISRLKEEMIKVESEREEYRLNSNLLKEELEKLTLQHSELRNKAEQARRLQDELDEHQQMLEKVTNYENMIENLNKRNNDLKKELKSLTDDNVYHVQNIVKLKEEINQLTNHINRAEIYKRQLQDTQIKLSQETRRADRAELELSTALKENEKLYQTTNQLMRGGSHANATSKEISYQGLVQNNEDYQVGSSSSGPMKAADPNGILFEAGRAFEQHQGNDILSSMSASVSELKDRVARSEYENEVLQSRLNVKRDNDLSILTGLLENASSKCNKLEVENRHLRKKLLLLEYRIRDLMNSHNPTSSSMNNQANVSDSSADNTLSLMNRIEELQKLLFQKEHELMEWEAKYNRSILKARDVIRDIHRSSDQ